jgi:hypothetical protein
MLDFSAAIGCRPPLPSLVAPSFVVSKDESMKITSTFADAYHFRAMELDYEQQKQQYNMDLWRNM